jgi:hypothetical protein
MVGGGGRDEEAMWARVEAEEAVAKEEARAWAKANAQPACSDDEEDTKYDSSEGNAPTSSSEEVPSRKRLREDDEAGPSKKK